MYDSNGDNVIDFKEYFMMLYTVFPLLEAAASNFFGRLVMRLQFEGGYYSRAASITKNYVKMF